MAKHNSKEMAHFDGKETLECIPTSFQIKLEAQCSGLKLIGEDKMTQMKLFLMVQIKLMPNSI